VSEPPLVLARDLRVDVDGAVVLDHVSFESRGQTLAVWGDTYAIEGALAGRARVRSGSLTLGGRPLHGDGAWPPSAIGVALCDPPLPPRWSVRDYLRAGARLAGLTQREARTAGERALAELGLRSLAKTALGELPPSERRAVVIAQATLSQPFLLVAVAPLGGLSGEPAVYVAAVLTAATRERNWIVTVRDLHPASPEHTVASAAADVIGFVGGKLAHHGKLLGNAPGTVGYTLVVHGEVQALRDALSARGVSLAGGPLRYFVELGPSLGPSEVLALAHAVNAPIVELVPRLAGAPPR
jgi:predicted ABC-type transport system involved in lysophospholipase L1 biosynthesis ATPase subunit